MLKQAGVVNCLGVRLNLATPVPPRRTAHDQIFQIATEHDVHVH